jgi:hypothetical protein
MTRRAFQNETPPKFQRLLQYVGKNTLFHNRNHLPLPSERELFGPSSG